MALAEIIVAVVGCWLLVVGGWWLVVGGQFSVRSFGPQRSVRGSMLTRPLKYSASRRCPSSPLTATYDSTPHSRLVGRLDLQNISAACTACLFQQAVTAQSS